MNVIGEEVLFEFRQMIPLKLKVVILADRGFHKTRVLTYRRKMHFDYRCLRFIGEP